MSKILLVIGASHAGVQLVEAARKSGWTDRIVLIGDEGHLPYHRPPLSKDFLQGRKNIGDIPLRAASFYESPGIEVRLGCQVQSIDRIAHNVTLASGEKISYDKLALCTGARVRRLQIKGGELPGVCYLRTAEDVERMRAHIGAERRAVIIGGGYIGLEAAASLRKLGMSVTLLEALPRVLERVTAPISSEFFTRIHTEEGVSICSGAVVQEIVREGERNLVLCADGSKHIADIVVVGIGVIPNTGLVEQCGLEVKNGIVVDAQCRTSDPDIYAAGDCASFYSQLYARWMRLESVQNASDQARVAAAAICDKAISYDSVPWFWSDQYDVKLQIAGVLQGYDNIVVRGDPKAGRSYAAFYFSGDHLLAVDAVNRPAAFMFAKRALTGKIAIDKKRLADDAVDFKTLLEVS